MTLVNWIVLMSQPKKNHKLISWVTGIDLMTHSITESLRTVLDSMKCTVLLEKVIFFLINMAYVYSILMNQPKRFTNSSHLLGTGLITRSITESFRTVLDSLIELHWLLEQVILFLKSKVYINELIKKIHKLISWVVGIGLMIRSISE